MAWVPDPNERPIALTVNEPFEGDDELEVHETQDVNYIPQSPGVSMEEIRRRGDDPSFLERLPVLASKPARYPNLALSRGHRVESLFGVWLESSGSKSLGLNAPRFKLLDTPPPMLNSLGQPFWKRQTGNHMKLFGIIDICKLGGRAQGLLHRWDFRGCEDPHRLAGFLIQASMFEQDWLSVETVLKRMSRAGEQVTPTIYVDAAGSGHAGTYAHKVTLHQYCGFALAVQLLGTE